MASFDVSDLPFSALYPEVEPLPKPEIEPSIPPPLPTSPVLLALPPLATYPSKEALFEAIQSWSKSHGYAFITQRSRRLGNGLQKVQYACDRWDRRSLELPTSTTQRTRETQTRGTGCLFSVLGVESSLGWEVRYRLGTQFNTHNHLPSLSSAAHPSHRHLSIEASKYSSKPLFCR